MRSGSIPIRAYIRRNADGGRFVPRWSLKGGERVENTFRTSGTGVQRERRRCLREPHRYCQFIDPPKRTLATPEMRSHSCKGLKHDSEFSLTESSRESRESEKPRR